VQLKVRAEALLDVCSNDHIDRPVVCQTGLGIQYVNVDASQHAGAPARV